ncbi:lipoprotein [Marivirga lumbricoides]|uniref:Lipoprotein n=1 Tax=Marivirga lumbricoides TaxID=1046115 RepID=A0ABQ1MT00_9BACT|nr:lipoprotein [Marivirga lumbricoides]
MKNRISKILKFALCSIFIVQVAFAQQPKEKALLWKVTGNGLEKPSYVFGTIHLICADKYEMSDAVLKAVENADKIALELDMDDPAMNAKIQQLSINPGMKNIQEHIPADKVEVVDNYFKAKYGQGIAQMGVLKPFVLSSMVLLGNMSCETRQFEAEFVKLAAAQEKELIGLETVEYQIGLFDDLSTEKQIEALIEAIETPEESNKMMNEMMAAYTEKDLKQLGKIIKDNEDFEGFNDKLLVQRNKNWIPIIEKLSREQSVFYAVGAGHLTSEEGVIALLRKEGFTVEAVK